MRGGKLHNSREIHDLRGRIPQQIYYQLGYPKAKEIKYSGGAAEAGWNFKDMFPYDKVCIMVAGNAGRPGGSMLGFQGNIEQTEMIGLKHNMKYKSSQGRNGGQEEQIVFNLLKTYYSYYGEEGAMNLGKSIGGMWGLTENNNSSSIKTNQGIDYTRDRGKPHLYYFSKYVDGVMLSNQNENGIVSNEYYDCDLVFAFAPNASNSGTRTGSMQRTKSHCQSYYNYEFFKEGIYYALSHAIDNMIHNEVNIAIIAKIGTGIYAGDYKDPKNYRNRINNDFNEILEKVLSQKYNPKFSEELDKKISGKTEIDKNILMAKTFRRRHYFKHIIVPLL